MLKIAGWASVFDRVDDHGDVTRAGCFIDDMEAFNCRSMLVGYEQSVVIGRWDHLEETSFGLWVEGTILDEHHAHLVEQHAIWGLSIGYLPQKINQPEGQAQRELLTIGLKEISITPVPVNRHCKIMWTDKWKSGPSKAMLKAQVGGSTHAPVVTVKAAE